MNNSTSLSVYDIISYELQNCYRVIQNYTDYRTQDAMI